MSTSEINPLAQSPQHIRTENISDPVLSRLAREEPLTWWNPAAADSTSGLAASGVDPALVDDAAAAV